MHPEAERDVSALDQKYELGVARSWVNLSRLNPTNQRRLPDARWRLAQWVVAGEPIPTDWLDTWTRRAVAVLRSPVAAARDPAVAAARSLSETGPEWQRVAVEGYVLARRRTRRVAKKVGLAVEAVEAYEQIFFDIRDRLGATGFVSSHILNPWTERAQTDPGLWVRAYAYYGGHRVLETALDVVYPLERGVRDDVPDEVRAEREACRLAIGLRMTPVTDRNLRRWLKLQNLMRECGWGSRNLL